LRNSINILGGGPAGSAAALAALREGALVRVIWQWVWERNYAGVAAAGYDDITPAHISMFRYPTLDWRRLSAASDNPIILW